MQLGMIGLGRMGGNMAKRIAAAGHEVVGYDRSPESDRTVASLKELVAALKAPRLVWVMVPAGEATDSTINELAELLQPGDMIIDGGNSRYTDDARHAAELEPKACIMPYSMPLCTILAKWPPPTGPASTKPESPSGLSASKIGRAVSKSSLFPPTISA